MTSKDVIQDLEATIHEVTLRIRKRKNGPSADAMTALAKLVNSLRQLKDASKKLKNTEAEEHGGLGNVDRYNQIRRSK